MNGKVTLHDVYEINNRIEEKLDKLESRVSVIEIWRATIIGQIIILLAVVNFIIAVSFDWIKKKVFGDRI